MLSATISRRFLPRLVTNSNQKACRVIKRGSHGWYYRVNPPPAPKIEFIIGNGLNAFAWWWILTHCWYQFGHIVGEFPYPDVKKWTDEELGVALPEDI